jgi:hypothetical protein
MEAFTALAAKATENLSPGQSSGSSGSGSGSGSSSGSGSGSSSGSGTGSGSPTSSISATASVSAPAQNTVNAAPGVSPQSFFGLGAAAMALLAVL